MTNESSSSRSLNLSPDSVFGKGGLIARMKAKGFYLSIMMEVPLSDPPMWTACFDRLGTDGEWIGHGATPMEAAARAAEAALESEEKQ